MLCVDISERSPDRAVALEARAEGDLPHPVALPHPTLRLNIGQHIPVNRQSIKFQWESIEVWPTVMGHIHASWRVLTSLERSPDNAIELEPEPKAICQTLPSCWTPLSVSMLANTYQHTALAQPQCVHYLDLAAGDPDSPLPSELSQQDHGRTVHSMSIRGFPPHAKALYKICSAGSVR